MNGELERLRALSEASSDGPWQWLDGGSEREGDELQDGNGEMVATGFREDIVLDGVPINRDGSFAAAAVNYIRDLLARDSAGAGLLDEILTAIKDEVRSLAFLTPEDWDEMPGGDPIARTINAVFNIIDGRRR